MTEKYRKKRIKNSTRRTFVPGVPFCVRKSEKGTLGSAVGRLLVGTGVFPLCLYGISAYDPVGTSRVWSTFPAVVNL